MRVRPLTPKLGAEISGVELSADMDAGVFRELYQAFLRHQVLLFPPHDLSPGTQVALARRFGEVQVHVMNQYHADGYPELYRLSNLDRNGKPSGHHPDRGTLAWHTDGSWQRVTGQATIIYGEVMPHNLDFSRNRRHGEDPLTEAQRLAKPPVDHPVVRTHPETGRKCLFLGDHAEYILGLPYDEGRALIEELNALAVHPDLSYEHRWKARQLIAWDNRCVLHRATAYDAATQGRVIRRCTVLGEIPV